MNERAKDVGQELRYDMAMNKTTTHQHSVQSHFWLNILADAQTVIFLPILISLGMWQSGIELNINRLCLITMLINQGNSH